MRLVRKWINAAIMAIVWAVIFVASFVIAAADRMREWLRIKE